MPIEALTAVAKEIGKTALEQMSKNIDKLRPDILNKPIDGLSKNGDMGKHPLAQKCEGIKRVDSDMNKRVDCRDSIKNELTQGKAFKNTDSTIDKKNEGLTDPEKLKIKEDTGWSENIVDAIKTPDEANVYKEANLKEVNGHLERTDIEWNAKIPQDRIDRMRSIYGDEVADKWAEKTNMDLIKEGKAPYGSDGKQVNLHHIGQNPHSPLAELTDTEHKSNDGILHDKTKESEIDRPVFRRERAAYWTARYEALDHGS